MKNIILNILLMFFCFSSIEAVNIVPKYASITAQGLSLKIKTIEDQLNVTFKTSNQLILNNNNELYCPSPFDPKNCKAWVVAMDNNTGATDTCKISIVPWTVNLSTLIITQVISGGYQIYGKSEDTLYVKYKNYLYKTSADLSAIKPLCPFPSYNAYYFAYLKTPAGSFLRNDKDIYYSKDEKNWVLDYTTKGRGIRNSFAYKYDSLTQTTSVFAHDYSTTGQDTFPHSVYRKTISPLNQNSKWEKVFTFYSKDQWAKDKSLFPACRHIHTLNIDPYTGQIWIGTGDDNYQNHIYYSDDNGNTWKQVGMGTQEWRVLSIWFTPNYVYWSMDSSETQKIFRVSRDVYNSKGYWPDMSKKLTSGNPKYSIFYLIASLKDAKYYDYYYGTEKFVGDIVRGNPSFQISENNSLISLNDSALDYRELVTTLPNSALWCNATLVDDKGDKVTVIESNNEGHAIDYRPRVFGVKERIDGSVDIQELLSTDAGISDVSQLYPYEQDALGNMYFQTLGLNPSIYKSDDVIKTTLTWNDNSQSKGGEIVFISNSDDSMQSVLKIVNYEGKLKYWQIADKSFNWQNLNNINSQGVSDTISIVKEKNKVKYIRAIVQKEGYSAVASKYVKIEKFDNKTEVITTNNPIESLVHCFPNPITSGVLNIQSLKDSIGEFNIDIFSFLGQTVLHTSNDFNSKRNIELYLNNLPGGIYMLKIANSKGSYIQKIVIK
jgi:hypothetical protein